MNPKSSNTWWSGRFLRSLERLGLSSRLQQGREYLQRGHVLSMVVGDGWVESRVLGAQEYICRIEFAPLTDLEWEESYERLAFSDLSAAALLTTGRLPPQIEDFFAPSGRRLLPQHAEDLEFSCSCPDRVALCQHLAATAYLFAERLDRDPWLLFMVRGRSSDEVMAALVQRWNRGSEAVPLERRPEPSTFEPHEALTNDIDRFWKSTHPIDFDLTARTERPFPTARRLGSPEPKVDEKVWNELLGDVYLALAKRAEERLENMS